MDIKPIDTKLSPSMEQFIQFLNQIKYSCMESLIQKNIPLKLLSAAPPIDLRLGIIKRHYFPIKATTYQIGDIETTIVHLPERYISGIDPYKS